MCFYRRCELPQSLVAQADKHHWGDHPLGLLDDEPDDDDSNDSDSDDGNGKLSETKERERKERAERVVFKQREVFLSRQVETLPATLIRGKCSVTLLSEVESIEIDYAGRDDAFFYALVYDPQQKTLVADRGEIRIGSAYQATVPAVLADKADDTRVMSDLEETLWSPNQHSDDVDKFLVVARSVGTFARALDCSSSVKQPSLHMSAAAASRDITLFHAHNLLHKHDYKLEEAVKALVPSSGPVLCRDEMEDWSSSEANLFEEAIEKYGKDFGDIRRDFLPWKSMKNIIEYFFMWKTTDRYVQQKRVKAIEAESKLKQVYVPTYTNKSTRLTGANGEIIIRGKDCDAYPNLPRYSWREYKKYGRYVAATVSDDSFILDKSSFSSSTAARLAQLRPGLIIEGPNQPHMMNPMKNPSGKTRAAFYLRTTPLTRAARQVCRHMVGLRHAARKPGKAIDMKAVKAEMAAKKCSEKQLRQLNTFSATKRKEMAEIIKQLGQTDSEIQEWLILTPKADMPKPEKEAFPRPEKRADGSYIYERVANAPTRSDQSSSTSLLYKKRPYEEREQPASSSTGSAAKVQRVGAHVPNVVPPKGRVATLTRVGAGHHGHQKQVISWMDAPDDVFYKATPQTKKWRKRLPVVQLRRAARKPFKKVLTV